MEKDWNLIDIKEVAEILGIAPTTIRGWIQMKKMPFPMYRIAPHTIRFKRTDVLEYLEKVRTNG